MEPTGLNCSTQSPVMIIVRDGLSSFCVVLSSLGSRPGPSHGWLGKARCEGAAPLWVPFVDTVAETADTSLAGHAWA